MKAENNYELEKRKYVIGGAAVVIIVVYLLRLFSLQLLSEDFKRSADSNAFLKRIQYPARGAISDRNGKLLVFNQPAYDVMVIMKEQIGVDTLDLCESLDITRDWYERRMEEIKDRKRNPGYSSYTQQLFMSQLSTEEFSRFQEKLFRFPGFYIQKRSIRQYNYPNAAHLLGDVGEVGPEDIEADDYYRSGDYIGKLGVERSYESVLRGEKGMEILLRDARGRIKGRYQNGKYDIAPIPGRNLKMSIDIELQALGERLMKGKLGSIVVQSNIRPSHYDRPTARQEPEAAGSGPIQTTPQPCHHGTIPSWLYLQDKPGAHVPAGRHHYTFHSLPLQSWLSLQGAQGWLSRTRFATATRPCHRYLVQRILLLGTLPHVR